MLEMDIRGNIYYKNQCLNSKQLMSGMKKVERILSNLQLDKKEIVALYFERNVEMITTIFALLRLKIPFMPIDKKLPLKRINNMLQQANIKIIITDENAKKNTNYRIINIKEKVNDTNLKNEILNRESSDIAYVIFTSGSTGEPKGVVVGRRAFNNFVRSISDKLGISKYESILCATNYSFDMFFLEAVVGLLNGLNVFLTENLSGTNPREVVRLISEHNINCLQFTPSTLLLLKEVNGDLSFLNNVKCLLLGGEQLSIELLKNLQKIEGLRIYNLYGPTEATVWVSFKELTKSKEITIGSSIDNVDIFLLDENGEKIADGRKGQICLSGVALAEGYLNGERGGFFESKQQGKRIYKTGDIGYYNEKGEIVFSCRKDRQIKLRGFRIELDEIDAVLQRHEAVMFSKTLLDEERQKIVTLCKAEEDISIADVNSICMRELPYYMVPEKFIFIDSIPLLNNGKIDKTELQSIFVRLKHKSREEKELSLIEQCIYKYTDVVIKEDTLFSTLKLNSLDYIKLIVEIEKECEIEFEDKYLNPESFIYAYDMINYVKNAMN